MLNKIKQGLIDYFIANIGIPGYTMVSITDINALRFNKDKTQVENMKLLKRLKMASHQISVMQKHIDTIKKANKSHIYETTEIQNVLSDLIIDLLDHN